MKMSDLMNVSGQQLLNLSKAELLDLTRQLTQIANQRMVRLEKRGLAEKSPAYLARLRDVGNNPDYIYFTPSSKNTKAQLRQQFKKAQYFLNLKTSSINGLNSYISRMKEIAPGLGDVWDDAEFWKVIDTLREQYATQWALIYRTDLIASLSVQYSQSKSFNFNYQNMRYQLMNEYAAELERRQQYNQFYTEYYQSEPQN